MDVFKSKGFVFGVSIVNVITLITFCESGYTQLLPVFGEVKTQVYFRDYGDFSPAMLQCYMEGYRNDTSLQYYWIKNNKPFDPRQDPENIIVRKNGGDIVFLRPMLQDAGLYRCFIQSRIGIASSPVINLTQAYIVLPDVSPQWHSPVKGKPYMLECPVPKSHPEPTVIWATRHRADPTISSSILDQRITQGGDANLYFSSVSDADVSDVFKYDCLGIADGISEMLVFASHFIQNLTEDFTPVTGELVPQYLSEEVVAFLDEDAFIYCIYGGSPLTPPDWRKGNVDVNGDANSRITRHNRSHGKRLLIKNVTLEDEGSYTCTINNNVGPVVEHTATLRVVGKPKFRHDIKKQMIIQVDSRLELKCTVEGKPIPDLTWTHDTYPIQEGSRIKIYTTSIASTVTSMLVVDSVTIKDIGYYGCMASNSYGSVYTETAVELNIS